MKIDVDSLFGQFYPQQLRKYVPTQHGVGFFSGHWRKEDGKFDPYVSSIPAARQSAQQGRPRIKIPILWDDKHRYGLQGDVNILLDEAEKWDKLAEEFPDTRFVLSPFCEYGVLPKPIDWYLDLLQAAAPHCEVMAQPSGPSKGIPAKRYRNEWHGADFGRCKKGDWYSLDGSSAFDVNVQELIAHLARAGVEVFSLWIPQKNRKGKTKDTTARTKRVIIPVEDQIKLMFFQLTKRGKADLDDGFIYKVAADQAPEPAYPVREDSKPVLVAPANVKHAKAELLLANGKVIAEMPYHGAQRKEINGKPIGPVIGQLYRMGAYEYGHQVAARVAKKQKQKVVKIRLGGKIIGTVNPGMRENEWRFD